MGISPSMVTAVEKKTNLKDPIKNISKDQPTHPTDDANASLIADIQDIMGGGEIIND